MNQLDLFRRPPDRSMALQNARAWVRDHRRNAETHRRLGNAKGAEAYEADAAKEERRARDLAQSK